MKKGNNTIIQDFTYDDCGNQLTSGANRYYQWNAGDMLLVYKNQVFEDLFQSL